MPPREGDKTRHGRRVDVSTARRIGWLGAIALGCAAVLAPRPASAQDANPAPGSATGVVDVSHDLPAALAYKGRRVEQIQVLGNTQVSTAVILNLVRTKEGEPFDPATVVEDYQRIYRLNKFSNVEPRLEPTAGGVIVTFIVTEQKQIRAVRFRGNVAVETNDLINSAALKVGDSIDPFRINLAKTQIVKLYHDKNYPFAHVDVSEDDLTRTGEVIFTIVEGPMVRIRKVGFIGNSTFSAWRLKDQIKTAYYIPIFRSGAFDPETVDADTAAIKQYYHDKGFFDARVGRKLSFSGDQTDLQVTFIIDEGPRYIIDHVLFKGNAAVPEGQLRKGMKMLEGQYFDKDVQDRDIRVIVRDYSPYGFIYASPSALDEAYPHPEYLHINTRPLFKNQPGHIDLVYDISEGNPFYVGRIFVKGNAKTQDKVVLRELRFSSGQRYNSAEVEDALDRLKGTPYFSTVSITPIGDDPAVRDVLVEVAEQRTASISVGAGVNSNLGLSGNISYEQKNFDITNLPASLGDIASERAFTGAGQDFRASFNPGTVANNADFFFGEPYLFDQPYSFDTDAYLRSIIRENYTDSRIGDTVSFGKRFDYVYSVALTLKAEDIDIHSIEDKFVHDSNGNKIILPTGLPEPARAPEILNAQGHHTLTEATINFERDTTNHGPVPYRGDDADFSFSKAGSMGGTVNYNQIGFSVDDYQELNEDLLDRRTVLLSHFWTGDDLTNAPFYERYYGGGIGSVRGFAYRGISPRAGRQSDPVGGDFGFTSGLEMDFPIAEDILRGDIFTDQGDFEPDVRLGTIRVSVGAGFRLILPFLNNQPLRVDFGIPVVSGRHDKPQVISFAFGISR
jgi:outer membrane protein insertion porin family